MSDRKTFEWKGDKEGEGGMATFHFTTGKCEVRFTHFNAAHTLGNWIQQDRKEVHQQAQSGAYKLVRLAIQDLDRR